MQNSSRILGDAVFKAASRKFKCSGVVTAITDAESVSYPNIGTLQADQKVIAYWVQPGGDAYDSNATCSGGTPNGFHGTHVVGSVLADRGATATPSDANHDSGDGMAPNAQILFQDIGGNNGCLSGLSDIRAMFAQAYAGGAGIHSNSWGSNAGGAYTSQSTAADTALRVQEELMIVFSAGNSGPGGNTIGSPGTAKNVLTVGAMGHGNSSAIAGFSSRGPTDDGRVKPDIVAPGSSTVSAAGDAENSNVIDSGTTSIKSGTSMSAPTIAGGAALARQYFEDGFYPTGAATAADSFTPSGMLLKTVLLNGTGAFVDTPSTATGWGRMFLDNNLYFSGDARNLRLWEKYSSVGLQQGETDSYQVTVNSIGELRVSLSWYDPAGTPGVYTIEVDALAVPGTGAPGTDRQGYGLVVSQPVCSTLVSSAPANLSIGNNDTNGVTIDFNSVSNAEAYQLYRADGSCAVPVNEFSYVNNAQTTSVLDDLSQGGFPYAYRRRAVDSCGEGPVSDCINLVSNDSCSLLPDFDQSTVIVSNTADSSCGVDLQWGSATAVCPLSAGVTYNVYRSTDPFFVPSAASLLIGGVAGGNYEDTSVLPDQTYFYSVNAVDSLGNESFGASIIPFTPTSGMNTPGVFNDGADAPQFMELEAPWQVSDEEVFSGIYHYKNAANGANYPNNTCAAMTSPIIDLQNANPTLSYQAKFDIEINWDGVVVEISTDGGSSWADLPPDGGYPSDFSMTQNPPINACGYPASQGAFGGNSAGLFQQFAHNLSAFAGQSVQIRWRFSSDGGAEENGFLLDDIEITDASRPGVCSLTNEIFMDGFES